MEKKLSKLFYSTDGYWKGMTAIKKLMDISGITRKNCRTMDKKTNSLAIIFTKTKIYSSSTLSNY